MEARKAKADQAHKQGVRLLWVSMWFYAALLLLAEASNVTTLAIIAPVVGTVIVAAIGVITARVTHSSTQAAQAATTDAKAAQGQAAKSAIEAQHWADVISAKDDLIETLREQVEELKGELSSLKRELTRHRREETARDEHIEELVESQAYAAKIQKALQEEVDQLKGRHSGT